VSQETESGFGVWVFDLFHYFMLKYCAFDKKKTIVKCVREILLLLHDHQDVMIP